MTTVLTAHTDDNGSNQQATPTTTPTFLELGVPASVVEVLERRNITIPTPVQVEAIPLAVRDGDLVVQAKTGTGKTLAFGLPLMTALAAAQGVKPRALVVTPTRELCLQVANDLIDVGGALGLRCVALYGGQDFAPQISSLNSGVDIVVGTPGRLLDLTQRGDLQLDAIERLILDEADEMLDMGFLPDVQKLLRYTANRTHTMLFSATMPAPIMTLARGFLNQPTFTSVADASTGTTTVSGVSQYAYHTHPLDKAEMLAKLLQASGLGPSIVFCRTKMTAQRLADDMNERGFQAASLHGDLSQPAREHALASFRGGSIKILIATDVAARGIDIDGITHVINYQTPEDAATYLHRIGRTARAGRKGIAVTFVEWDNLMRWKVISSELGLGLDDLVETFSTSEHFHSDLAIPTGTRGRLKPLPRPARPSGPDRHGSERRSAGVRRDDVRHGASTDQRSRNERPSSPGASSSTSSQRGARATSTDGGATQVPVSPLRTRRRTRRRAT